MSLSVLTNMSAMDAQQNLQSSSNAVAASIEQLSSGLRINSAADDAAGYAISEDLTAQVNGLGQAGSNVADATSMVQTAEGSLNDIENMLQRMRQLTVQYQTGTNSQTDKDDIQAEVDQLTSQIKSQTETASFNGQNLLDGTAGTAGLVTFQVGANDSDTLSTTFADLLATNDETSTTAGLNTALGFNWGTGGVAPATLDQEQAGTWAGYYSGLSNTQSIAQTFTAGQSGQLDSVQLYLAGSNSNPVTVEITNTASGAPGSTVLATATIAPGTVTSSGGWVTATFSAPATVANGTQYAIAASGGGSDHVQWAEPDTGTYSGGAVFADEASPPDGSWNPEAAGFDAMFQTYVGAAGAPPAHVFDLSQLGGAALTDLDQAIDNVSSQAATLGAFQNRLQYTSDTITSTDTNLAAANSQITDLNMATGMTNLTQEQILVQAGTAMLSQAQSQPQMILKLLSG